MPGVLAGNAVYFVFHTTDAVVKFDLTTREMEMIRLPATTYSRPIALITSEDGSLGFAGIIEKIHLWSMVASPSEKVRWAQSRIIELEKLLPVSALKHPPIMLGSVGVIYLYTDDGGKYSVDLKSNQARKMPKSIGIPDYAVPFVSFCTAALRAASADEEPGASASSA